MIFLTPTGISHLKKLHLLYKFMFFRRFRSVAQSAYYLHYILPSVHKYQCGTHLTDFLDIHCWRLLWKCVEKIQIWFKSSRYIRTLCL